MDRSRAKRGSALIIVLAALAVLAGLAVLYSLETMGGSQETRNFRDDVAARWLARAGIEAAMQEIAMPQTRCVKDGWNEVYFLRNSEPEESELARVRQGRVGRELEPGYRFSWSIRLADDRADLNQLDEPMLHRLFEIGCNIPEGATRTALVNAILDWTDNDDTTRTSGAEEDYYQSVSEGKHCKNAAFDSVEELLLVKGMTTALLYGSGPRILGDDKLQYGGGIARYLDINTGNRNMFRIDNPELKYILTDRKDETLDRDSLILTDDEKDEITNQARPQPMIITGRGWIEGGVARHAIRVILSGSAYSTSIILWQDNAGDPVDGVSLWEGYHPHEK